MSGKGKQTQRLDKILSHMGVGTRSELKKMVKQGRIYVDGKVVKDSGIQVNPEINVIEADGERIMYRETIYLMLHKPPGVVSATEDARDKTVLDLLRKEDRIFQPFPVGRLDKDTEGLLILTNDGPLAHELLSPANMCPKRMKHGCSVKWTQRTLSNLPPGCGWMTGMRQCRQSLPCLDMRKRTKVRYR